MSCHWLKYFFFSFTYYNIANNDNSLKTKKKGGGVFDLVPFVLYTEASQNFTIF